MKIVKIKLSCGYVGEYVADFKPGDLITAYQKGYHRFVKYEDRGEGNVPLIHYTRANNFNGKPCNSKTVLVCDAAYCRPAIIHLNTAIQQKKTEIEGLEILRNSIP